MFHPVLISNDHIMKRVRKYGTNVLKLVKNRSITREAKTLKQWFSTRGIFPGPHQGTLGSVRRHFWFSNSEEGYYGHSGGKDAANHTITYSIASHNDNNKNMTSPKCQQY